MNKDISVIISTYNSPEWLTKVLYGYNTQTYRNFEVIIADDGSDERTRKCLEEVQKEVEEAESMTDEFLKDYTGEMELTGSWQDEVSQRATPVVEICGTEMLETSTV